MIARTLIIAALAASPALAQAPSSATANPNTGNARMLWLQVSNYITRAAADVPEATFAFKATPEVRSFGEIIGHVAGSQRMFCAVALGEKSPPEDAVEKAATSKAALVQALKESNDYCARAYAMSDKASAPLTDVFGQQRSRLYALLMNVTHDNEHYGNIVTYMRLNKMVPPSSK